MRLAPVPSVVSRAWLRSDQGRADPLEAGRQDAVHSVGAAVKGLVDPRQAFRQFAVKASCAAVKGRGEFADALVKGGGEAADRGFGASPRRSRSRRSRSMIASSALDLSACLKLAPFSSSAELSAARVCSRPLSIACWPTPRLSEMSRVRAMRVSLSWRARSPRAALSFSVLASSVEAAGVSNSDSSALPRWLSWTLSISSRVSNSSVRSPPDTLSAVISASVRPLSRASSSRLVSTVRS